MSRNDTEEEESEEESEEEEEEETEAAPTDGIQTPSGLETPSGLHSVVSTVPGGLETPDFLELRKSASRPEDTGPRQLYHVVPEKQTTIRGLVGSERGYDVSAVASGAQLPVLGEERGTKVSTDRCPLLPCEYLLTCRLAIFGNSARRTAWRYLWMLRSSRVCRIPSFGPDTTPFLAVQLGFPGELHGRTFQI